MLTAMKTMAGMGSRREGLLTGAGVGFHELEEAWTSTGGRGDEEVGVAAGMQNTRRDSRGGWEEGRKSHQILGRESSGLHYPVPQR